MGDLREDIKHWRTCVNTPILMHPDTWRQFKEDAEWLRRYDMTKQEIEHLFTYHAPANASQREAYGNLREAGKHLALTILDTTPQCADQSAAIRKVREAVMTANAAIATNGGKPSGQ